MVFSCCRHAIYYLNYKILKSKNQSNNIQWHREPDTPYLLWLVFSFIDWFIAGRQFGKFYSNRALCDQAVLTLILIYVCPMYIKTIRFKFIFLYSALHLIHSKWPPKTTSTILNHIQTRSKSTYLDPFFG